MTIIKCSPHGSITDVTLCVWRKDKCPLAIKCHRALAKPDEVYQSYFAPTQYGQGCPYFVEEEEHE